jgi:hypothetical protein
MAEQPATNAEQLNLKVKSQVIILIFRTVRRSFSRSKVALSSRNSWMHTARDKM